MMFRLGSARCGTLRASGFMSLMVQLLHSHTYEHEPDLEVFIDKYQQKARLRKQLSQTFRTFLEHSSKNNELEIYDALEVLRSFVENLYTQNHDRGLDFPCREMKKVYEYTADKNDKEVLEMLGGVFVIVDVLRALFRICDNSDSDPRVEVNKMREYSYLTLDWLIDDNKHSIKFLCSIESFIWNTKVLLRSSCRTGNHNLLRNIASFLSELSFTLFSESWRLADCELVKPIFETVMMKVAQNEKKGLENLLMALRNCVSSDSRCRNQLAAIDNWPDLLLTLLDGSHDTCRTDLDNYCQLLVVELIVILRDRIQMPKHEKERFIRLCHTPKICRMLVETLRDKVPNASWTLAELTGERDPLFFKQLRKYDIVPELKKLLLSPDYSLKYKKRVETTLRNLNKGRKNSKKMFETLFD